MAFGIMIPMIFMIFIFTGSQALVPESIAGDKERGTLGSMLVTPASRSGMATGKILGLGVFALLSAVGSMIGILLSMPAMMPDMDTGSIFDFYTAMDIIYVLLISVSTTLVFVAMLSVMSAYAKSVKEANAYAMPVMVVIMIAGLAGVFLGGAPDSVVFYLIPVVNSALSITAIFGVDEIIGINILVTAAVNLLVALLLTIGLARIFSSEKIVFDK
jgi:sodium transport system permease protein